ncbi:DMT family transporter [Aeromicrobium chenweiae]|uniref:DMT family transporter n=1 Tax=Aeromicrobium chenweiae TaxID=2079793 RepID=UPI0018FF2430|nr:SMR family transporter [Aeromicrobium chenweiae]
MRKWLLLGSAIAFEVSASLSLKGALDRPLLYAVVVVGYVASFVLLSRVLVAGLPLGVTYGIWGAVGVAATAVLSAWIFDERLTALMLGGITLVIAGVLLVEIGSQRARSRQEAV